jgi:hypothetical protein
MDDRWRFKRHWEWKGRGSIGYEERRLQEWNVRLVFQRLVCLGVWYAI